MQPCPHLLALVYFTLAFLTAVRLRLMVAVICISLISDDTAHHLMCLFAFVDPLANCPSFLSTFDRIVFFLLRSECSLFAALVLCQTYGPQTFPPRLWLVVSFSYRGVFETQVRA